jgi:carboxylesterase
MEGCLLAIMRGAEPFLLPGGDRGVLLLHGFTGAPSEMRLLGEHLNRRGYTVLGPRLTGHGTSPADMAGTRWPHWYGDAEDGYHLLRGLCGEVSVAGLSMGALLALKLAAEHPVARLAAVNAPVFLLDKRLPLLPLVRLFRRFQRQEKRRLTINEPYNVAYEYIPLACAASLLDLIRHVDRLLPLLTRPVLLVQSRHDRTVRPESVLHLHHRIGSHDKKIIWLEKSGHVATIDVEHERVFRYIENFFATRTSGD